MADKVIDNNAHSDLHVIAGRGGIFWTSPTVGYAIYVEDAADNLVYKKTADGGATWGGAVNIRIGDIHSYDCWADWQTAGDAGTKIHIAYTDNDTDDVRYVYLDTSTDTVGGDAQIEACQGTGAFTASYGLHLHNVSITKTRGGNLAVAFVYQDDGAAFFREFYTSPDAAAWTNEASPWEATFDYILLFPGNEADPQDVWAVFWDTSANEISLKTYDDSGDSWSEQLISGAMADSLSWFQMAGAIRLSDGHLIFAAWNLFDNAAADLKVWDINGAGSITAKTNVITNTVDYALVSVFINQDNDDIYVAYFGGTNFTTQVKAFYQKSADGGANWGGQTAMQANAEDDERWISCGAVKAAWGGKFQPVWFNDDNHILYTSSDNGISIAAAAAATYIDIPTRFKLIAQTFTDIPTRFKLEVQNYTDIATRFRLFVQNYTDIATRFRLEVQGFIDIATRFILWGRSFTDIATRFKLSIGTLAYKDIAIRFKLWVQNYTDIATRFKLQVQNYTDISTRFKLWATSFTDIATRFKLEVQNYTDIATRFRLFVQNYTDIPTRFKLWVQQFTDIATRFKLEVQNYTDIPTRFKLFAQNYTDIATRFFLVFPYKHCDISTRFFLYVPTWKELQIQAELAALQAQVDALDAHAHFRL